LRRKKSFCQASASHSSCSDVATILGRLKVCACLLGAGWLSRAFRLHTKVPLYLNCHVFSITTPYHLLNWFAWEIWWRKDLSRCFVEQMDLTRSSMEENSGWLMLRARDLVRLFPHKESIETLAIEDRSSRCLIVAGRKEEN
jgi:hypothetical protein